MIKLTVPFFGVSTDNTPYYYYLKAKDGSNVSEESNIIGVVTSIGNP